MVCTKCGKEIDTYSLECSCGGNAVPEEWGVIQIETTGLHPELGDEILKIVLLNKQGEVVLNRFYRPTSKRVCDEAEKINHISPEDVAGCSVLKGREAEDLSKLYLSRFTKLVTNESSFVKQFFKFFNIEAPQIIGINGLFEDYMSERNELVFSKGLKTCAQYFHYDDCQLGERQRKVDKAYQIWFCYQCLTGFNKKELFANMRGVFTVGGITYETFSSEEQMLDYLKQLRLCPLLT